MSKLEEAFFADLARHMGTWRDDFVKAVADPSSARWSEHEGSFRTIHGKSFSTGELEDLRAVVGEALRGILHSTLASIDGATILTETGRLDLVDADTKEPLTEGALHEEFFGYLAEHDLL